MKIVRKGNPIKERTYLVLIDIFILMCAMGVSLGILFITLSPAFGLVGQGTMQASVGGDYLPVSEDSYNTLVSNSIPINDTSEIENDGWYRYSGNQLLWHKKAGVLYRFQIDINGEHYDVSKRIVRAGELIEDPIRIEDLTK